MQKQRFSQEKFKAETQQKLPDMTQVLKADTQVTPTITEFELLHLKDSITKLHPPVMKSPPIMKAESKVPGSSSPEKVQNRCRFNLHPLLRDALAVDEKELQEVEEKIQKRVSELAVNAKKAAAEEGYQEGLKRGRDEGFKSIQQDQAKNIEFLEKMIKEIEAAKFEIFKANERFLIELIYRISKKVVLKEISLDQDYLKRLVLELMNRVDARDFITLRLNPADMKIADSMKAELSKTLGGLSNINIESSTRVERGGCNFETEWIVIDTNVDFQLQAIYESLIGKKGE